VSAVLGNHVSVPHAPQCLGTYSVCGTAAFLRFLDSRLSAFQDRSDRCTEYGFVAVRPGQVTLQKMVFVWIVKTQAHGCRLSSGMQAVYLCHVTRFALHYQANGGRLTRAALICCHVTVEYASILAGCTGDVGGCLRHGWPVLRSRSQSFCAEADIGHSGPPLSG